MLADPEAVPVLEPPLTEARMRAAVAARDAGFDGHFVYAVRSTGVYCRPGCPSRAARPDNLSFHAGPAEAEEAGFRPCRRCRPGCRACRRCRAAARLPRMRRRSRGRPPRNDGSGRPPGGRRLI